MLTVPFSAARRELVVMNSRFIASVNYAGSIADARKFIAEIRREFSDATHNVPAFIVGGGNSTTEFCSDDGEPSGTSGKPLLAVLRGARLGYAVIVVTRYFGGTLLGTGGLVKAYSEAGKRVLASVKRAVLIEYSAFSLRISYSHFEPAKKILLECGALIADEDFSEEVRMNIHVPSCERARFEAGIAAVSAGSIIPAYLGDHVERKEL